ncbi:MAG: hypothetical protein RBU37_09670 [Myxococcota bacterium]|nr:hypothetical protein [Myxococcota bacterium]
MQSPGEGGHKGRPYMSILAKSFNPLAMPIRWALAGCGAAPHEDKKLETGQAPNQQEAQSTRSPINKKPNQQEAQSTRSPINKKSKGCSSRANAQPG